jgi:hypothetical protein
MASPEPTVIAVELAEGHAPIRLRWEPGEDPEAAAADSQWRVESQPDWDRLEGIRTVSARFEDGRVLGVVSLRPRGAPGHGDDLVIARLVDPDGQVTSIEEALVSVQYDADGIPRRLGIELWPDPDSAALRVAADRKEDAEAQAGEGTAVALAFRLDGTAGSGVYQVVRPRA